jgi:hypothetical protein
MTQSTPKPASVAVALVREALAALPAVRGPHVLTFLARRTRGWPRRERERLTATLALLAADMAGRLPEQTREEALAVCAMTDEQLIQLLSRRLATGLAPVATAGQSPVFASDSSPGGSARASHVPDREPSA